MMIRKSPVVAQLHRSPARGYEKLIGDRVGEIRQFCKLPDEGQSLMRAAMI